MTTQVNKYMKCNHHKKLEGDIPAWLWFAFYPGGKWEETEEKEQLMKRIKLNLEKHLESYDISDPTITEPNRYDTCYSSATPCECSNIELTKDVLDSFLT